jgi:beta-1,4-mannosyl-glycoprotein beta-1,4-N-acetylglucosaminyltransferase
MVKKRSIWLFAIVSFLLAMLRKTLKSSTELGKVEPLGFMKVCGEACYNNVPTVLNDQLKCEDYGFLGNFSSKRYIKSKTYYIMLLSHEISVLELALSEIFDVVDIIVILESTHNFHGNRKPLYFERNKEKFTRYLGKIRHIVMDISAPEHRFRYVGKKGLILGAYKSEWATRHHLRSALWDISDNDVVTWGDVDEILSQKFVLAAKGCMWQHEHFTVHLEFFYYNFKCYFPELSWFQRVVSKGAYIKNIMSSVKYSSSLNVRTDIVAAKHSSRNYVAPRSKKSIFGWHASYFGGFDTIMLKVNSIAYFKEKPEKKPKSQDLLSAIHSCKDFINRSSDFGAADTSLKLELPQIVKSNKGWFSEMMGGLSTSPD